MFRKVWLFFSIAMAFPAFAHAAWNITATVKGTAPSAITLPQTGVTPYSVTITGGIKTVYEANTSANVTITAPTAGLTGVVIDGSSVAVGTGAYTINKGTTSHAITFTYAAAPTYTVSSIQPSGGSITLQEKTPTVSGAGINLPGLPGNATVLVTVTPNADYTVSSFQVGTTTYPGSSTPGQAVSTTIGSTAIQTNPTVTAALTKQGWFNLSYMQSSTQIAQNTGSVTLDASKSTTNDGPLTYTFTTGNGAAIAPVTNVNPGLATFSAAIAQNYTIHLLVTGVDNAVLYDKDIGTVQAMSTFDYSVQSCTQCHNTRDPQVVSAYQASTHFSKKTISCADCHNGNNPSGHHEVTVTAATCESCHSAALSTTTHPVAITASKCLGCHDAHNPAAGIASLAPSNHPAVTLYTFEEIGMQMAGGQKVPVMVGADGKGMPYSPKQTCGTSNCHVKNGVDYTYDKISDHAFHSAQGRNEYVDSSNGKLDATKSKPWYQSTAMVGKW